MYYDRRAKGGWHGKHGNVDAESQNREGLKTLPAVYGNNGRVRPGYVSVNGEHVLFEWGTYELRYHVNRKARYEPAGDPASEALAKPPRWRLRLDQTPPPDQPV